MCKLPILTRLKVKIWITRRPWLDLLFLALFIAALLAVASTMVDTALPASTMVDIPPRIDRAQQPAAQPQDAELQRGQVLRCQVREVQMAIVVPAEQAAGVLSYTQLSCGPHVFRISGILFAGAGPQSFFSKGRDAKTGMLLLQPALPALFGVEEETK